MTAIIEENVNEPIEAEMYSYVRAALRYFHQEELTHDHFVYLLCDDGSLQITKGGEQFLTRHFCEQREPLGWKLRHLPVKLGCIEHLPSSAIAVTKSTALELQRIFDGSLQSVASVTDPTMDESLQPIPNPRSLSEDCSVCNSHERFTVPQQMNEQCRDIYSGAFQAALRWRKVDPYDIAQEAVLESLPKLQKIRSPKAFGWTLGNTLCKRYYRIKCLRIEHEYFDNASDPSIEGFEELVRNILDIKDTLDAWLLTVKLTTGITMETLTHLANHWTKSDYSVSYYRLRMHSALEPVLR